MIEIIYDIVTSLRNSQRRELIFILNVLHIMRVSMIDMSADASATRGKQTLIMGLAWGGWLTAITKIDFTLRVPLDHSIARGCSSRARWRSWDAAQNWRHASLPPAHPDETSISHTCSIEHWFNPFKKWFNSVNQ